MTYRLHPKAALEHEEQVAYYEERRVGLGKKYHRATMQAIDMVVATPKRFRLARLPDFRQIALRGFPFSIIYREAGDTVQVLAVAHHRRHPNYWSMRA